MVQFETQEPGQTDRRCHYDDSKGAGYPGDLYRQVLPGRKRQILRHHAFQEDETKRGGPGRCQQVNSHSRGIVPRTRERKVEIREAHRTAFADSEIETYLFHRFAAFNYIRV